MTCFARVSEHKAIVKTARWAGTEPHQCRPNGFGFLQRQILIVQQKVDGDGQLARAPFPDRIQYPQRVY
jgi:hypothetical protein